VIFFLSKKKKRPSSSFGEEEPRKGSRRWGQRISKTREGCGWGLKARATEKLAKKKKKRRKERL
jgi:hypothetical protein